jgi:NADPH2:quinone reductase
MPTSRSMKAMLITETGGPEVLKLTDVEVPKPGAGEILLRQTVAGLNFVDVSFRAGRNAKQLPFVLGREGVGIVEAVGDGVTEFKAGERAGYSETPWLGGYAEYNRVPAAEAVPIPAGVDDKIACAAMLQGMTAQYLTSSTYPVGPNDTVLVHAAAGGVGRLLVQFAKSKGATVIATAGGPEKCALAKSAGADYAIDYRAGDFAPEVLQLTGGKGVNVCYDAVGADTFEGSFSVMRRRGVLVLYGASSGRIPAFDTQRLGSGGSLFMTRPTLTDYKRERPEILGRARELFELIAAGKLDMRIGATYPLAQAAEAHRALEGRQTTGKVLLTI